MRQLAPLLPYLRPYRGRVVRGMLAIVAATAVGLLAPLVIGRAIDAFFEEGVEGETLLLYAASLIGITAVRGIFSYLQRKILVTVSRNVEHDLRCDYFEHLELMAPEFYRDHRIGDLMARATSDLQAVRMLCGPAIMYGSNTLFTASGALFFMVAIDPGLTALALVTMPLVAVSTQVIGQRVHRSFVAVQEQFGVLTTKVQENLTGVRVVRAYVQEAAECRSFAELNEEYVRRNRRLILWSSAFRPLLQALVGIGFVAVLWYGGGLILDGKISVGEFVTFHFFLGRLVWPMIAIGWVINQVQRGSASLGRILAILEVRPTVKDVDSPIVKERLRGDIELRGLSFRYGDGAEKVLEDVGFRVEAGQTVALVGRTGSGKSTLLSLLARLYEPPMGSLFVDGTDVRKLSLRTLRSAISVVPQEGFLFSATLRENIAFGAMGEVDEVSMERVCKAAGLAREVARWPDGLDTRVGERGITLSGGQKQRVSLARALLRQAPILILDDSLSAVDTQTEEEILGNLRSSFVDRTVFLVSHRISTVRHADLILVLENGKIAQRGRHEELSEGDGLYASLRRLQRLEDELATA